MDEAARVADAAADVRDGGGAVVEAVVLGVVGGGLVVAHIIPVGIPHLEDGVMGGMDIGGDGYLVLIDDDGGVLGQEADADVVLQEAVDAVHGAAVTAARDVQAIPVHEEGIAVQLDLVSGGGDLFGIAVGNADDDLAV